MSTLIVEELYSGVVFSQPVTITRNVDLGYVRAWVYLHGTLADGELTLRVKNGATLIKTVSIDYTLINAVKTDAYGHGFIRFDTAPLPLNIPDGSSTQTYTFEFEMTNHSTDVGNFLGVVRGWEDPILAVTSGTPADVDKPLGIELYEFKAL